MLEQSIWHVLVLLRRKRGEEGQRVRGGILGLGLLIAMAVFAHGYAAGCSKAEILAINDDGESQIADAYLVCMSSVQYDVHMIQVSSLHQEPSACAAQSQPYLAQAHTSIELGLSALQTNGITVLCATTAGCMASRSSER